MKDRNYYRKFSWSKYQRDVFTEVVNGDRNIAVEAVAGSGKTTLLKGIVHWLPSDTKIRVFCFNKSVAEQLERELPGRVKTGTAHSYGFALCMGATGSYDTGRLTIEGDKYWKLASAAINRLIRESDSAGREAHRRYPALRDERVKTALLKGIVEVCHIVRVALPNFRFQDIKDTLHYYGSNIPSSLKYWAIRLGMDCIIIGNRQASESAIIDFDDMLWLPHLWKRRPLGKVDLLMIDEAQDTTAVSQSLYRKFIEDGARLVAVGDSAQSILAFAGSLPDAFPIIKQEFSCLEFPLPVSYRCPTSHVKLAKQIVPQIEAAPGAIKGEMVTVEPAYFYENVMADHLVLSRMTAPLVRAYIQLVFAGKKAQIRGNDLAEGFCSTATAILQHHPMPRFPHEIHNWLEMRLQQVDSDYEADNAADTAAVLQSCHDAFGNQCLTIEQFCDRIRELFKVDEDEAGCIILSTIHSAKGSEANIVWLLNSNELPVEREDANQEQQEINLTYVAITRAIQSLFFVPSIPVDNNVGGISILEDIDWDSLPNTQCLLPNKPIPQQLGLF